MSTLDDKAPRFLPERTGTHVCIRCLKPIPAEEYFGNDYVCDACAAELERELDPNPKGTDEKG